MFSETKIKWNRQRIAQITDVRNITLVVFGVIVVAITWSGVKTVQNNYELQKKISELKQENAILQLQKDNVGLENQYLNSPQYEELTARRSLGLAAPGEKVLIVPKNVALSNIKNPSSAANNPNSTVSTAYKKSKYANNLEAWRNFLLGRNQIQD